MASKYKPVPGERYGRYTVLKQVDPGPQWQTRVLCRCDCGKEKIVSYSLLRTGKVLSCGCYGKEQRNKGIQCNRKHNKYSINNDIVYMIPSNTNKYGNIIFDKEDLELLKPYTWMVRSNKYVTSSINNKRTQMHRLIMDLKDDSLVVDHINGNPLDNRRCNLRICFQSDNCINKVANHTKLHSKYKGVFSSTNGRTYFSTIQHHGKQYYLGSFSTDVDAAIAYDTAAKEIFGEYAKTNFHEME